MIVDRNCLAELWSSGWKDGLWAAAWSTSVGGLTPQEAAWSPAPGRHSIWQIVLHMCFWREESLRRLEGEEKATPDIVRANNFPAIAVISTEAWDAARARLERTQDAVLAAMKSSLNDPSWLVYLIPHDAYHIGQINYLRAMLGKSAIE